MRLIKSQIALQKKTVAAMVRIYCSVEHVAARRRAGLSDGIGKLCADCQALLDYAHLRLTKCPYQDDKPTCVKCPIHCYKPDMKERIKTVMRRAGPRMLFLHPWLTVLHFWKEHVNPHPAAPPRRVS